MKTQFAILVITLILMQTIVQTEAGFFGKLWEGIKGAVSNAIGKRGLRDVDQLDDLYDFDLSDADVKLLREFFK
uniref:Lepturusin 5 n=1 Tax=Hemiscorpius lepturus TaxID=520031 RepID=A0A1L4BJ72_HEMLE|nr:venom toxin [Hemiscorpius lepturus]